jgi:hypothetical protein
VWLQLQVAFGTMEAAVVEVAAAYGVETVSDSLEVCQPGSCNRCHCCKNDVICLSLSKVDFDTGRGTTTNR